MLRFILLLTAFVPTWIFAQQAIVQKVHFDSDQATLATAENTQFLKDLTQLNQPLHTYRAFLIGHTDNKGSLKYNQALSRRRAEHVQALLVEKGLPKNRIELSYKAYLDPLDTEDSDAARAKNRRVDILLEPWTEEVSSDFISINTEKGGTFEYSRSKTKISIPPNALCYPDGRPFKGEAVVSYREFRDYADFMASDIPMNFDFEGGPAYFESSGMFELNAFSLENEPLAIAKDKSIDIAFEQTQVQDATNLWYFDETQQAWQSGTQFIDYEQGEVETKMVGSRLEAMGYFYDKWYGSHAGFGRMWERDKTALVEKMQETHAIVKEVIESAKSYDYKYSILDNHYNMEERFERESIREKHAGTDYIAHLEFEEVYQNPSYYNIEIVTKGKNKIFVKDLSNKNPELAAMQGVVWIFSDKNFTKKHQFKLTEKRFSDVRIKRIKRKDFDYQLILKYQGELIRVPVRASKTPDKTLAKSYSKYRKTLKEREEQFEKDRRQQNRNLQEHKLSTCIQLLFPRELPTLPEHLTDMEDQYLEDINGLTMNELQRSPDLKSNTMTYTSSLSFFALEFVPRYQPDWFSKTYTKAEWIEKIENYTPAIYSEVPIYQEVYKNLGEPVPVLRLNNIGVFNLDVLKRFEEEKKILATYETESGQPITLFKVEVINHRLNGLLRFTKPEIYLDLGSPTTLVAHATDGKVYCLKPDDMKQLDLKTADSYTFQMKPLGDYVAKPELIRELLAGT